MTDFWDRHVFVLISPDAVRRGVLSDLVRRLAAEQFPPVAARLATSDSDMIDEMYADLIAGSWETWRYRMIDDAFALGQSVALICRYTGDADNPHALMKAKKGHQHPSRTSPGELRRDFGAVNSILGVMHASDNPEESRKDAAIFGLTPADVTTQQDGVAERVALLCALTEPASPERRDFDAVLGGVRAQILGVFWDTLTEDATVKELASLLNNADSAVLAEPKTAARLLDVCHELLPEDVLDVLSCDFTPATRGTRRGADLFAVLRRHGVELDPWQRVVLESSLYFEPARRHW
ncbi:nucleoside-diphosphate kinase [Streptomyces sp. NPDC056704]|uniref:nucleoside-diphosphate kinase n=1 Tax=Streptomyces sp. NPDC056704 TaxID=3345917 RepID=UPI00368B695E